MGKKCSHWNIFFGGEKFVYLKKRYIPTYIIFYTYFEKITIGTILIFFLQNNQATYRINFISLLIIDTFYHLRFSQF